MKKCGRCVLGVDPSGNYEEGKGHTGLAVFDADKKKVLYTGYTFAENYPTWQEYFHNTWVKIQGLMLEYHIHDLSIEDYVLYGTKAKDQINSKLETPRIIGYLLMQCWYYDYNVYIRPAVRVKKRWHEDVLVEYGYIEKQGKSYVLPGDTRVLMTHELDAIKHAVHCAHFELEDG